MSTVTIADFQHNRESITVEVVTFLHMEGELYTAEIADFQHKPQVSKHRVEAADRGL